MHYTSHSRLKNDKYFKFQVYCDTCSCTKVLVRGPGSKLYTPIMSAVSVKFFQLCLIFIAHLSACSITNNK